MTKPRPISHPDLGVLRCPSSAAPFWEGRLDLGPFGAQDVVLPGDVNGPSETAIRLLLAVRANAEAWIDRARAFVAAREPVADLVVESLGVEDDGHWEVVFVSDETSHYYGVLMAGEHPVRLRIDG